MLSSKLIAYFKSLPEGAGLQIDKDARSTVVNETTVFLEQVLSNCQTLAQVSKRKTYKLIDTVNAVAQALQSIGLPAAPILSAALASPIDERAVYLKEHLPETKLMYETIETAKGSQCRVKSLNTVKLSAVESLFSTTQKAAATPMSSCRGWPMSTPSAF